MSGLLLSEQTNDLIVTNGDLQLSRDSTTALRQRIYITLNAWVGEWKLNTDFGIPYRQSIFVKGVSKEAIDTIFLAKILEFDEVESIDDFFSEFNPQTRTYDIVRLVVRTSTVFFSTVTEFKPDDGTTYQDSALIAPSGLCDLVNPANKFHQFLHFDLVGLWD